MRERSECGAWKRVGLRLEDLDDGHDTEVDAKSPEGQDFENNSRYPRTRTLPYFG